MSNFRVFQAGPDPRGRLWQVEFLWLQTAISIRHSDTVDVKFLLEGGEERLEKVIALPHAELRALAAKLGRPVTDAWCAKLAARHLQAMVETDQDMEKPLVTCTAQELERHATEEQATVR